MIFRQLRIAAAVLCIALLLHQGGAIGSTLLALDLDTLTQDADYICTGKVLDSVSFIHKDRIFTLHRISVVEAVAGDTSPGDVLEMVTVGGRIGRIRQQVSGAATVEPKEEYLFFLEHRGKEGFVYPIGMVQGVYRVSSDAADGPMIHPSAHMPRLIRKDESLGGRLIDTAPWIERAERLDTVKERIRSLRGMP